MKIVLDRGAFPPIRAHADDAGLDMRSPVDVMLPARGSVVIDTGVHVAVPAGCAGFIKSRSGLMCRWGITTDGTVDSGYTGSIRVCMINHSDMPYHVHRGDKVAQLVIVPVRIDAVEIVDELPWAERGDNGFGSTGK